MKRCLIIDDDEISLYLLKRMMGEVCPDLTVDTFNEPEEALERLTKEGTPLPDLILLDINMPRMNAWDFLRALQERQPNLENVSMAFMSSLFHPKDRSIASSLGISATFLTKPVQANDIQELAGSL